MSEKVNCSICGKPTPAKDVCSTEVCRACHKSITLEDCVNRTTPEELAWNARKFAALNEAERRKK